MPAANERQEGGNHYQGRAVQHWDLVALFGWDYFQSQVIKYVMRWKDKYRGDTAKMVLDLKKARHVLDKYIEEIERGVEFPSVTKAEEPGRTYVHPDADEDQQAAFEIWWRGAGYVPEGYYTARAAWAACANRGRQHGG